MADILSAWTRIVIHRIPDSINRRMLTCTSAMGGALHIEASNVLLEEDQCYVLV